jgi:hypothetical protein
MTPEDVKGGRVGEDISCMCMLCAPRDSFTGQLSAVEWVYSVIYIE